MSLDEDDFPVNTTDESGQEAEQVNDGDIPGTGEDSNTEASAEGIESDTTEAAEAAAKAKAEEEAKAKAEAAAKAKAEIEHAVKEFMAAVEAAVNDESVDSSTGTIPEALVATVTKTYSAIPGKGRKAAQTYLQDKMQECMVAGTSDPRQFIKARSHLDLLKIVQSQAGATRETVVKQPVDPTEALLERVVPALLAAHLILPGEGVAADWAERANAKAHELTDHVKRYREYLIENEGKTGDDRAPEPEGIDRLVLAAARLAQGKPVTRKAARPKAPSDGTPRVSSGVRRDVAAHIAEYFADKPVGHWASVSEIANFDSQEYAGDHPSSGAVSARLYPKSGTCTLDGVAPEARDKKGAVKTA